MRPGVGAPSHQWQGKALRVAGVLALSITFTGLATALRNSRSSFLALTDDSWSYVSATVNWVESGDLALNGWIHMFFAGQGWVGARVIEAFGHPYLSLHVLVMTCGAIGLLTTYAIARRLLSVSWALVVLVLTGFNPIWMALSTSFMTDVPMWTLALLSIFAVLRGEERSQPIWFVMAGLLGLAAFSVREYGVVPVVVMLFGVVLRRRSDRTRAAAGGVLLLVIAVAALAFQWRQGLPGTVTTLPLTLDAAGSQATRLLVAFGVFMAPAAAIGLLVRRPSLKLILDLVRQNRLGALIGVGVAALTVAWSDLRLIGNVIHPYGTSWTSVGDGVRAVPEWLYSGVVLVGCGVLTLGIVGCSIRTQQSLSQWTWREIGSWSQRRWTSMMLAMVSLVMLAVISVAIAIVGAPAFDRYLMVPITLGTIVSLSWALSSPAKWNLPGFRTLVGLTVAATAAVGLIFVDARNQVDGLRWQTSQSLVRQGIPAHSIDGGDAWFRFFQRGVPGVAQVGSLENSVPGRTWWQTFFEGSTFCRMVAIESETDLQTTFGPALSIQEERTLLGTPFRVLVFPGPDPC